MTNAAVVVTHDSRADIVACVSSLRASGADEVMVVDSGSIDATAAEVRASFPDVEVMELPNVGFGRAANVGVARTSAPAVLICNADTIFGDDAVRTLAAVLDADPDVAAVGPLVRYPDGRVQASARTLPTVSEAVGHAVFGRWLGDNPWSRAYLRSDADPRVPADVDWVSGCAVLVRRSAFEEVGGFDPGYFLFVEDVDLGYRLRQAGWRVRFCPDAEVVHGVGGSRQARPVRLLVEHARSLDRFYGVAYASGRRRLLRPLVRAGLLAWVGIGAVDIAVSRLRGSG